MARGCVVVYILNDNFSYMKTAIICPVCEKPRKESDSYAVKLVDYRMGIATRNMFSGDIVADKDIKQIQPVKVRVCRVCTKRMGYKVKAAKPKKPGTQIVKTFSVQGGYGGRGYGGGGPVPSK